MKINASLTLLINSDSTTIEVRDSDASICFLRIKLDPEQLSAALSRLANVKCDAEVLSIDKIGKTHVCDTYEFEIPDELWGSSNKDALHIICLTSLIKDKKIEWHPDRYYSSRDSFYKKDGKSFARCTIRKWIDKN